VSKNAKAAIVTDETVKRHVYTGIFLSPARLAADTLGNVLRGQQMIAGTHH
jgi:hypothetical protein